MKKNLFLLIFTLNSLLFATSLNKNALSFKLAENFSTEDTEPLDENNEIIEYISSLSKGMEQCLIHKEILLDGSHIQSIELQTDLFGYPEIELTLTEEGAELFADITEKYINRNLALECNGNIIFNAIIRQKITSGSIAIGGLTNSIILNFLKVIEIDNNYPVKNSTSIRLPENSAQFIIVSPSDSQSKYKSPNLNNISEITAAFFYYYLNDDDLYNQFINEENADYFSKLKTLYKNLKNPQIKIEQTPDIQIKPGFKYIFRRNNITAIDSNVYVEIISDDFSIPGLLTCQVDSDHKITVKKILE